MPEGVLSAFALPTVSPAHAPWFGKRHVMALLAGNWRYIGKLPLAVQRDIRVRLETRGFGGKESDKGQRRNEY